VLGKVPGQIFRIAFLSACLALASTGSMASPSVLGWLEGGFLQPWGVRVRAKLDTGALTSSIHAENVVTFERNGETWVRFHFPFGKKEGFEDGFSIEKPIVRTVTVKEHDGRHDERLSVNIDLCVDGNTFPVEFTLADRSEFNYPILLGRRALAGRYYIDAGHSFIAEGKCPRRDAGTGELSR
jgi:hypothetical protein